MWFKYFLPGGVTLAIAMTETRPKANVGTGRKRPKSRDNRRPQLLDSAARHFRLQGYEAASMRDIAARAGMKAGSMYYYFPSKEDLLIAVHEEGIRRITSAVTKAITTYESPWERLRAAMSAHLDALLDGGDYAQVVIRELPRDKGPARQRLTGLRDDYETIFSDLAEALPLGSGMSRRYLRLMILGALNWSQSWYRPGGDTPDEIAAAFVMILKQGDIS